MTDIVQRLRGRPAPGDHCSKLIAEAADEIERLRALLARVDGTVVAVGGEPGASAGSSE